jgi:hypothetical protein
MADRTTPPHPMTLPEFVVYLDQLCAAARALPRAAVLDALEGEAEAIRGQIMHARISGGEETPPPLTTP